MMRQVEMTLQWHKTLTQRLPGNYAEKLLKLQTCYKIKKPAYGHAGLYGKCNQTVLFDMPSNISME
jgi:hypothetical protein